MVTHISKLVVDVATHFCNTPFYEVTKLSVVNVIIFSYRGPVCCGVFLLVLGVAVLKNENGVQGSVSVC